MNAVSRLEVSEVTKIRRWHRLPTYVLVPLYGLAGLVAAVLVFQLFFRYQYFQANGVTWRIDRVTQQTCQLTIGQARCAQSGPVKITKPSTSTSTSTSISTSVSLKVAPAHKR